MMTFDPPKIEKGSETGKAEMDRRRKKEAPRRNDPNLGIPQSNNLPNDDKPSALVIPSKNHGAKHLAP